MSNEQQEFGQHQPPPEDGHHMLIWAAATMCRAAHFEGTDEDATQLLVAAGKHIKERADKMKFGMSQANAALRQQLAAANARLAAAERLLACATDFEIYDVRICQETFGDQRWYAWHSDDLTDLEGEGFESFEDAYAAAIDANWLPAEPQQPKEPGNE